jgi:tRNA threonylcarbamoyladenosine biosynthesis protein TsaB
MKILSLDCSTAQASIALLENGEVCRDLFWVAERARHEDVADRLAAVMGAAGWRWDEVDLFTVGRGPGAYSGLRSSLLAMQALAAPGGTPVLAVSSMDALALRLMTEMEIDSLTIVGDARRNSLWMGHCERQAIHQHATPWRIIPRLATALPNSGTPLATPHWNALEDMYRQTPERLWIKEAQYPSAEDVARLAQIRRNAGASAEPLAPLYLHDAVQQPETA